MRVEDARRLLGPDAIIGLSIKTVALANAAPLDQLDYVGVGGVYATTSKDNPNRRSACGPARHRRGLPRAQARSAGLRHRRDRRRNAAPVIAAGADGVAVISALSMQADPEAAARELRGVVDAALKAR
jgi:thiamine-phosphate pyrophosphorylase